MTGTPASTDDRKLFSQELRFAVVMSGGVSLAVWMGGVTNELNRLRMCDDAYGEVLELLEQTPRVDVIAGTSAGGLNGVFLSTAIAYHCPIDGLRDVWLRIGAFTKLLRSPLKHDQLSLLKGDDYFLPQLRLALHNLVAGYKLIPASDRPLDLIVTGSLLSARPRSFTDGLGNVVPEADHAARFIFRRGNSEHHYHARCPRNSPLTPGYEEHGAAFAANDDFADPLILDRLALAGRASASFPIAFEPAYCPIDATTTNPDRSDMRCYANFQKSHFVMDGGVLMNKPIGPALQAVYEQKASTQVRRVMLYVVPDPGAEVEDTAENAADAPSIAHVGVSAMFTLPRGQSVANEIREIEDQNNRTRKNRDTRAFVLYRINPGNVNDRVTWLLERANELYAEYLQVRARAAVALIIDQLARGLLDDSARTEAELSDRSLIEAALRKKRLEHLPAEFPDLPSLHEQKWEWGYLSVERAGAAVVHLLNEALSIRPVSTLPPCPGEEYDDRGEPLELSRRVAQEARGKISNYLRSTHDALASFRELRAQTAYAFWRRQAPGLETLLSSHAGRDEIEQWAADAFNAWPGPLPASAGPQDQHTPNEAWTQPRLKELAITMANALAEAAPSIYLLAAQAPQWETERADRLRGMVETLVVSDDPALAAAAPLEIDEGAPTRCLHRLLALEVVDWAIGGPKDGFEQLVKLVQVSAETPNAFDARIAPNEKVAGLQLGHFGGFYKSSWRSNDWMWGRLDGAFRLIQTLLDPDRIRELYQGRRDCFSDRVKEIALDGSSDPASGEVLAGRWNAQSVRAELAFLDDRTLPAPKSLPACTRAIATRIQLGILRTELIELANAITADERNGANESAVALRTRDDVRQAIESSGSLRATDAVQIFRRSGVGLERIEDEMGSDLFTATAATAAAVTAGTASGSHSGLNLLSAPLKTARALLLVVYALAQSAVQRTRTSFALIMLVLAAGSTMATIALTTNSSSWVGAWGAFLLAVVIALLVISSRTYVALPAIIVGAAIGAVPWVLRQLADPTPKGWSAALTQLQPVFIVVGIFVAGWIVTKARKRRKKLWIPCSLRSFAETTGLSETEMQMLARIRFLPEDQPHSEERWSQVYTGIRPGG